MPLGFVEPWALHWCTRPFTYTAEPERELALYTRVVYFAVRGTVFCPMPSYTDVVDAPPGCTCNAPMVSRLSWKA